MDTSAPRWSSDVGQADWIGPRLSAWEGEYAITIFVPAGFEAYARVLHPVGVPEDRRIAGSARGTVSAGTRSARTRS